MKKARISMHQRLLLLTFLVWFVVIPSVAQASQGTGMHLEIQSTPAADAIRPDLDVVQFSILVNDEQGQPVKDVELAFTLNSPAKKFFPSTDFPIVEGTTLMDSKVLAPQGKLDFQYVFPIRGEYSLKVKATPSGDPSKAVEKTLHISINENPPEVRNAFLLILGLFLLGCIVGYILTSNRVTREAV